MLVNLAYLGIRRRVVEICPPLIRVSVFRLEIVPNLATLELAPFRVHGPSEPKCFVPRLVVVGRRPRMFLKAAHFTVDHAMDPFHCTLVFQVGERVIQEICQERSSVFRFPRV